MSDKEIQEAYERTEKNYETLKDRVHEQFLETMSYKKEAEAYNQAYESMKKYNEQLKTYIEIYKVDLEKLKVRIDKALEYIEENCGADNRLQLKKILKGE